MSEENNQAAAEQQAPQFSLQRVYVKDLSFEAAKLITALSLIDRWFSIENCISISGYLHPQYSFSILRLYYSS